MLTHLKNRVQYYVQVLLDIRSHADESRRLANTLGNKTIENHVARIGRGEDLEPDELSYSFPSVCKRLPVDLPKAGAPARIALCSIAVGESYTKLVQPCLKSHVDYAARYGFDRVLLEDIPGERVRSPHWYKIPLIYRLFQAGYAYVMFIDADAIITNPSVQAEALCNALGQEDKVLYIAEDSNGVNSGVFFMRNRPDAVRLLDLIWLHDFGGHSEREQDALVYLLDRYPQIRRVVKIAESGNLFNSFPGEQETLIHCRRHQLNTWKRGDFVCHFAGLRGAMLERLIGEYAQKISP